MILFSCKETTKTNFKNLNNDSIIEETPAKLKTNTAETPSEQCFIQVKANDSILVHLKFKANEISGEMVYKQHLAHNVYGTLKGNKKGDGTLDLIYSYMVDGSNGTETKIMKIENNQLYIKVGELEDDFKGNLSYKSQESAKFSEIYSTADCSSRAFKLMQP